MNNILIVLDAFIEEVVAQGAEATAEVERLKAENAELLGHNIHMRGEIDEHVARYDYLRSVNLELAQRNRILNQQCECLRVACKNDGSLG